MHMEHQWMPHELGLLFEKHNLAVLGLQETRIGPKDWQLRPSNLNVLSSEAGDASLGEHSVALVLHTSVVAF